MSIVSRELPAGGESAVERFWRFIAVELGKHAGLVSVIGLLVTLILGFGITRLQFSTGQDSYLNKSDTVYKDNVAYQRLFGGQAMLTLVTMDKGHTVNELFTPENQAKWRAVEDELGKGKGIFGAPLGLVLRREQLVDCMALVHGDEREHRLAAEE